MSGSYFHALSDCDSLCCCLATEKMSYAEAEKERASIVAKYRLVCTAKFVTDTTLLLLVWHQEGHATF